MKRVILIALAAIMCFHAGVICGMEGLDNMNKEELNNSLYWAAHAGNTRRVISLIEADADVDGGDTCAPLGAAINIPTILALLDRGASIYANKTSNLYTPLHVQAGTPRNNFDVIELLITRGAAVLNALDEYGRTALGIAVEYNHSNAARALIEGGADVSLTNVPGKTLLQLAVENKKLDAIKALTTTVSPTEIQHVIPAIIALTNPHNDPDKETMFPQEIGLQISAQLIPVIVREKLVLAKQYLPNVPEAELRAAIEQSIRRVISKSPRIQDAVQQSGTQEPVTQKDRS